MQNWVFVCGLMLGMIWTQQGWNWLVMRQAQKVSFASSEVDDYRLFLFAASAFMSNYKGGAGELYWADLSSSDALPDALKVHSFSQLWRVLVLTDRTWVVCSPLGERALGMQTQFMSAHGLKWLPIDPTLKNQTTGATLRYMDELNQSQGLCK